MKANILRKLRQNYKLVEYNDTYWMSKKVFNYYIIDHFIGIDLKDAEQYYRDYILEKMVKKYYKFYI